MTANDIIAHDMDGTVIGQRASDGYINATAMCKAAGKLWADYRRQKGAQDFLDELARSMGIPIDLLVLTIMEGANDPRGTWVHPYVAIHSAHWLSPRFAVRVSKWVYHWSKDLQHAVGVLNKVAKDYLDQGYPPAWVRERIDGMLTRRELTDLWANGGALGRSHYGILTRMLRILSIGLGPAEHKELKGLTSRQNLRDNSTELELLFIRLGEQATIEIARAN